MNRGPMIMQFSDSDSTCGYIMSHIINHWIRTQCPSRRKSQLIQLSLNVIRTSWNHGNQIFSFHEPKVMFRLMGYFMALCSISIRPNHKTKPNFQSEVLYSQKPRYVRVVGSLSKDHLIALLRQYQLIRKQACYSYDIYLKRCQLLVKRACYSHEIYFCRVCDANIYLGYNLFDLSDELY